MLQVKTTLRPVRDSKQIPMVIWMGFKEFELFCKLEYLFLPPYAALFLLSPLSQLLLLSVSSAKASSFPALNLSPDFFSVLLLVSHLVPWILMTNSLSPFPSFPLNSGLVYPTALQTSFRCLIPFLKL